MRSFFRVLVAAGLFLASVFVIGSVLKMRDGSVPTKTSLLESSPTLQPDVKYEVVLKENTQNASNTDVYLKDPETSEETLFLSAVEINRQHYHASEYHRGNLYVIQRTGGGDGYLTNPNWTDELWRYDQQKKGQKLFTAKGLDFRVDDDEKRIAIFTNESVDVLDSQGQLRKSISSTELDRIEAMPGFLAWGPNSLWVSSEIGPKMMALNEVDTRTFTITKHDISQLDLGTETVMNPGGELLIYSNYPAIFDVDGAQDFEKSRTKVTLTVYNLKTQKKEIVATATTKRFTPRWLDQNTLEYNDPKGEGRVTRTFP